MMYMQNNIDNDFFRLDRFKSIQPKIVKEKDVNNVIEIIKKNSKAILNENLPKL